MKKVISYRFKEHMSVLHISASGPQVLALSMLAGIFGIVIKSIRESS